DGPRPRHVAAEHLPLDRVDPRGAPAGARGLRAADGHRRGGDAAADHHAGDLQPDQPRGPHHPLQPLPPTAGAALDAESGRTDARPQQLNATLAATEQRSTQLRLTNGRQTLALARREALERQLADVETAPAMATTSGAPDTAATRLARLRNELRELRTQYTEK